MKHAIRSLLMDVYRGEIGPAIQARAGEILFGKDTPAIPRRSPKPLGTALVHHDRERSVSETTAKAFRRSVRAACVARSRGCCEACGDRRGEALSMDHFWGRAREESVAGCWMLCARCDRDKTENRPSRLVWLDRFAAHCQLHGYDDQLAKLARAIPLELAQHPQHERRAVDAAPPTQEAPCPVPPRPPSPNAATATPPSSGPSSTEGRSAPSTATPSPTAGSSSSGTPAPARSGAAT